MHLTAVARGLAPRVRAVLTDIETTLVSGRSFEPATSTRRFRLVTNDYCATLLLPPLMERFVKAAPGCSLDVHPLHGGLPSGALDRGELDLVLGSYVEGTEHVSVETLFEEDFSCLVPKRFARRLTSARYIAADHLLVANPGYGPGVVDHALARCGATHRVVARVPHFMVAPAMAARAGLLVTLPTRVAKTLGTDLRLRKPPLELHGFAVQMFLHAQRKLAKGGRWLRQLTRGP